MGKLEVPQLEAYWAICHFVQSCQIELPLKFLTPQHPSFSSLVMPLAWHLAGVHWLKVWPLWLQDSEEVLPVIYEDDNSVSAQENKSCCVAHSDQSQRFKIIIFWSGKAPPIFFSELGVFEKKVEYENKSCIKKKKWNNNFPTIIPKNKFQTKQKTAI